MRPQLKALTGLRFVAAAHVVAYHALRPTLVDADTPWARVLAAGPSAVTLFFVLSGFVLTWAHADAVRAGTLRAPSFWRDRFARIAPLYWLALGVALPIGALARAKGVVTDPLGVVSLLLVATGTQAFVPAAALRWNAPAWSLSCELFFYALFPLVAPWLLHIRRTRALAAAAALWLLGVGVCVAAVAVDANVAGARITDEGTLVSFLKFSPLLRLPEFIVGIVAARLFLDGVRVPRWGGGLAVVVSIGVAASGAVPYVVLHDGVLAPLFALLIMALAGSAGGPLASRPAEVLGEASYALYLMHVPLMLWVAAVTPSHQLAPPVALATGLCTIPVAIALHYAVERPARARLRAPPASVTS